MKVISIEAFLGALGGLTRLLFKVMSYLVGDYVKFEAKLRWIKDFYKFKSFENVDLGVLRKNHRIDFCKFSILGAYIVNYSMVSRCCKICQKRKK